MGTTLLVRDFRGEVLRRGTIEMHGLLEVARRHKAPLLSSVDEYDDTVFNRSQAGVVLQELRAMHDDEPDAVGRAHDELVMMVDVVQQRPHRYLVFNGD